MTGFKTVRHGDRNSAGGRAIRQQTSFYVDGRPVITDGSPVTCHPPGGKHCQAKTAEGTRDFLIEGIPVNIVTNKDTCGHPRVEGSSSFILRKK